MTDNVPVAITRMKCEPSDNLKERVARVVEGLGGWHMFIKKGDKVLLKPNFNTADPYPASSDPAFIRVVVELCYEHGASMVYIGDSSTMSLNTRKVMKKLGIFDFQQGEFPARIVSFDEGEWEKKEVPDGKYLTSVSVPALLSRVDVVIFLACLKTHFATKFSGSMKLAVGTMKPIERIGLHLAHIEEKVAELCTVVKPTLTIMDARKVIITRGPAKGDVREPHLIFASADRLALDKEGIALIKSFPGNDLARYSMDDLAQIVRAEELHIR